jgi:hypothetical protein
VCDHAIKPSGKPRDPESGCTGRAAYRATCKCGWEKTDEVRESIKLARENHRPTAKANKPPRSPRPAAATLTTTEPQEGPQ